MGSASTRASATAPRPTRSMISSVTSRGSDLSRDQLRRNSAAARMFSRAVSEPKTSSRWKVRAMPEPGPPVRRQPADVAAVEDDPAARRLLQAGDDVERRGLAGAVGTDQPGDVAGVRRDVGRADRLHPAEPDGDVLDREHRHVRGVELLRLGQGAPPRARVRRDDPMRWTCRAAARLGGPAASRPLRRSGRRCRWGRGRCSPRRCR